MEKLPTGSAGLNEILFGGAPRESMTLVTGGPGSGKTVLCLSSAFSAAAMGEQVVYFSTLAEPQDRILRYQRRFSFFETAQVDENVQFSDLAALQCRGDAEAVLREILHQLAETGATVAVVDGFKTITDMMDRAFALRTFLYRLTVGVAELGCTLICTGDYSGEQAKACPEYTVADGVIDLSLAPPDEHAGRRIEVLKMRGTDFLEGRHPAEITNDGVQVYPRRRPGQLRRSTEGLGATGPSERRSGRMGTGLGRLDRMLGGGLGTGRFNLVTGPACTGKTTLSLHLVAAALNQGDRVLLLSLDDLPEALVSVAEAHGLDYDPFLYAEQLELLHATPSEVNPFRVSDALIKRVSRGGHDVVVIDELATLCAGLSDRTARGDFIHGLLDGLRSLEVTVAATHRRLEGREELSGLESMLCRRADTVMLMGHAVPFGSGLPDPGAMAADGGITVLKARGRGVDHAMHPYILGPRGFELKDHRLFSLH